MRISTTTLDQFRLYKTAGFMTEQELQDSIRGVFLPNEKMALGSAFGAVLEDPQKYRVPGGYKVQLRWWPRRAFFFESYVMDQALALMDYRYGVFEPKIVGRYEDCDIVAKADQIVGIDGYEHKTTGSTFDFHKYYDALQWKIECDLFELQSMTYHVFRLLDSTRDDTIHLKAIETFKVYPYESMHDEIERWVREFKEYVIGNGLSRVLEANQAKAE